MARTLPEGARVTPLTFYPEWMVQVAHQGAGGLWFMVALAAPLPGTTYAGTRWSTLAYVEKVRPQFLSLRQRPHGLRSPNEFYGN
jgi:hypothetical protein